MRGSESRLSIDNPYFEKVEAKGSHTVEGAVKSGLVELLGTKCRMAGAHDDIELLESIDDGRHRLAFEGDLVCPGCHLAFIDL
jgi:hypothetical protein